MRCSKSVCLATASRLKSLRSAVSCSMAQREDGESRLLLQIFSEKAIGPIFEFIERKEDEGFDEGNSKALC